MKSATTVLLLALSLFSIGTKAQSSPELDEARTAIAKSNNIYFAQLSRHNGSIANLYTDDAWLLPPNSQPLRGREEIVKFFDGAYKAGARSGKFNTLDVYGDGKEYVTEVGLAQVYDDSGKMVASDKYMVIWKKTDKGWRIFRDMFSSNLEEATPWRP